MVLFRSLTLLLLLVMVNFAPTLTVSPTMMPSPHHPMQKGHPPLPPHTYPGIHPEHPLKGNFSRLTNAANVTNLTSITRLGHNICKFCKVLNYPCNVTERFVCTPSDYLKNDTAHWPIGTTDPQHQLKNHYDAINDDVKHPEHRRSKRGRPWRGGRRDKGRWHKHDDDFHHRRRGLGHHYDHTHGPMTTPAPVADCIHRVTKMCTSSSCNIECCDGTPQNTATGSCQGNTVAVHLECMNGGTLSGLKTYCMCPEGFTGNICQHRTCSMKCQNGGACHTRIDGTTSLADTNYMNDHCVCPADVSGKFCEIKACTKECMNNGTCKNTKGFGMEYCDCKGDFYGRRCEKETKAGQCPSTQYTSSDCRGSGHYYGRWSKCHDDAECPLDQKCCRTQCGRTCVTPLNGSRIAGCTYNNESYGLGTAFTPDACRLCTCNVSHTDARQAVVECTRLLCPDTPSHCANVTTPEGECCPVCNDDPDLDMCGGNYTYPTFVKCPTSDVVLVVGRHEDYANLSGILLYAQDCNGDNLEVYLSDDMLFAGRGDPEDNYYLVTATSGRDHNGHYADCAFHVTVKDPYPPEFWYCPTDFAHPHPGPVTWSTPQASDNVGLAIPPTSRNRPGAFMDAGDHMITYTTEDFEGNSAICTFVVSVGVALDKGHSAGGHAASHGATSGRGYNDHDHDHQSHSHPHPHPSASHASVSIGVGVVTSLIILVLIVIAFILYFRQRRLMVQASNQPASTSAAANNAANWNNHAMSQPHYSLPPNDVMLPPSYSQTDEVLSGICSGGRSVEAGELPSKKPMS